jgi:hypothetical protein
MNTVRVVTLALVAYFIGFIPSSGGVVHLQEPPSWRTGTAIITFLDPQSAITVGADSKDSRSGNEDECKIVKLGHSTYFTAGGFVAGRTFDSRKLAREAFLEAEKSSETIRLTQRRIKAALNKEFSAWRKNQPQVYRTHFDSIKGLTLILFGAEQGDLFIYTRRFELKTPDATEVEVTGHDCISSFCKRGKPLLTFHGHHTAITEYDRRNPAAGLRIEETATWIRSAMAAQIRETPAHVGGQIDIISIRPTGQVEWKQKKEKCEA